MRANERGLFTRLTTIRTALVLAVWSVLCAAATSHAAYVTRNVPPASLVTTKGSTDSNAVDVLAAQDQPNSSGKATAGVRVFTPKKGYQGVLSYAIPASMDFASASGVTVDVNYNGDRAKKQLWQFQIHDFASNQWSTIGDNGTAPAYSWTKLQFKVGGDLARFVSSDRRVEIKYVTKGKKNPSQLDMAVLGVTTYAPDAPPPPPPGSGPAVSVRSVFQGSFTNSTEALEYIATVPDLHVLSVGPSKVASLKALNPAMNAYHYIKVGGLHGPETRPPTGDPGWDRVMSDGLLWNGAHGPVTQSQNGWYYIDIQNPAKRAKWIEIVFDQIEDFRAQGYDSLFFDNASIIEPTLINEYPADYSDAGYFAAVKSVLSAVRNAYPDMKLIFNSYSGWAPSPSLRGLELLSEADGIYFEAFSMKVSGKYFDSARYLQQLDDFASVVASGKTAVAMDYTPVGDVSRRIFSLASYMLVNGPSAYHFINGTDADAELQQYPEDMLAVGEPLSDAVVRADGLVVRSYEDATVVVNPSTKSVSYALASGSWQSLSVAGGGAFPNPGSMSWNAISGTSVTLAPNTAVIARRAD